MIAAFSRLNFSAARCSQSSRCTTRKPYWGAHFRGLGNNAAIASIKNKADEHGKSIQPMILAIKARGIKSANGIAKVLNDADIPTVRRKLWMHEAS